MLKQSFVRHLIDNRMNYNLVSGFLITLKVPLLLITAIFNGDLLSFLQRLVGMKVSPSNYMWSNRSKMERQNMGTEVDFTYQFTRRTKSLIENQLTDNLNKNALYIQILVQPWTS